MISKIFYENQIIINNNEYLFEDNFLFYFINKMFKKKGPSKENQIIEWIKKTYKVKSINKKQMDLFLSRFPMSNDCYYFSDLTRSILEQTTEFDFHFSNLCHFSQPILYKNLCSYIGQQPFSIANALPWAFALDEYEKNRPQKYYSSLYFNTLYNEQRNYSKMDLCICSVDSSYRRFTVDFIFTDKAIIDILFANGINTLGELLDLSVESLLVIFSTNVNYFISILEELSDEFSTTFRSKIRAIVGELEEKEKNIIFLRNGFNNRPKMTLEEIGIQYGITRERIRQIEAKGMKKITANLHLLNNLFASLYFNLIRPGEKYFLRERVVDYVSDELSADFILLLMTENTSYIKYDSKLKIIYNQKVSSLREIEDEIIEVYGDYLLMNDYELLDEFEKKVINKNYRLINNALYLKRGILERTLYTRIIDDIYTDGYHISDETAFDKIREEFIKRYIYWDENITSRVIATYLERESYCQIDRGTYKNRYYTAKIPSELKDRIFNYILDNQPSVFYESIFEHFKKELIERGINNYYYLKGVIDVELPQEFTTKRNYIQVGDTKITSAENILMFMKSFNSLFTLDDLKNKFQGVKDYVFYNHLYREIDNGLIWLSSKKYIYIDKANINATAPFKLDAFLTNLFISLNTKVLSSGKIFSRLMLTNKTLLEELKIVHDQFSVFSLIRYFFKEKYFFSRPLIASDKVSQFNQETIMRDYVERLDTFNLKTIKAYQMKLSLRGLYSYQDFMEDMSDNFVQINMDTMVKKELTGIDERFLKEFGNMFSLIFSKYDKVDTRIFNGYVLLPKLSYKWNKYLLVGIIRTYFSDIYEVKNTDNYYNSTDFIIKKNKNIICKRETTLFEKN